MDNRTAPLAQFKEAMVGVGLPPELRAVSMEQWARMFCYILNALQQQLPEHGCTTMEYMFSESANANRLYEPLKASDPARYHKIVADGAMIYLFNGAYAAKDTVIPRHDAWAHVAEMPPRPTPANDEERRAVRNYMRPAVDGLVRALVTEQRKGAQAEAAFKDRLAQAALVFGAISHQTGYATASGMVKPGDPQYLDVALADAINLTGIDRLRGQR